MTIDGEEYVRPESEEEASQLPLFRTERETVDTSSSAGYPILQTAATENNDDKNDRDPLAVMQELEPEPADVDVKTGETASDEDEKKEDAKGKGGDGESKTLEGAEKLEHWARPDAFDGGFEPARGTVHILSPFDPLVRERKRLALIFGYEHRFEAYVPKDKRVLGYFALPVLVGDEIVAAVDLKTDREREKLLVQRWTWVGRGAPRVHKRRIEEELHRFERFQLGR